MKDMDSVFALSAEDELNFDTIFAGEEDDALCEAVEGFDEDGNSLLGDATFDELHQTADDGVTAADIEKELEGSENDLGNKDAEGTDPVKLDDSNSIEKLSTADSDADKFLDGADDEYQNDEKPTVPDLKDEEVTPDIEKVVGESTKEAVDFLECGDTGIIGDKEDFEYDPENEKVSRKENDIVQGEYATSDCSVTGASTGDIEDGGALDDEEDEYGSTIEYTADDEEELINMVEGNK